MNDYAHMKVALLMPTQWDEQGWGKPTRAMWAIVNTSDKYEVRGRQLPRIVHTPLPTVKHARNLLDRWIDEWEFEDMAQAQEQPEYETT